MKKWSLVGIASLALGLVLAVQVLAARPITLVVNGNEVASDAPPELNNGRVFVPIRVVAEALGAEVEWDEQSQSVKIQAPEVTSLEQQVRLLQEAIAPESAQAAAEAWAKGVKTRNGALQYAVMTPELKEAQRADLEALNWVTGVSSPWVDSYTIQPAGDGSFTVEFALITSTGAAGTETSTITVAQQDGVWLVSQISEADLLSGKIRELEANRFLLEGPAMSNGEPALYWISFNQKTKIMGGELRVGQQVTVEVDGGIMESYPAQAGAATIRIVK